MDVGTRVEIPTHTDRWMRGDRFGVVVARPSRGGRPSMIGTWFVKLDKSGKTIGFGSDALREV
jgi:hypothetical protein